ncbi:hypothetical protein [Streptomyces collinus]
MPGSLVGDLTVMPERPRRADEDMAFQELEAAMVRLRERQG